MKIGVFMTELRLDICSIENQRKLYYIGTLLKVQNNI